MNLLLPILAMAAATPAAPQDSPTPAALQATYAMAACMVKHNAVGSARMLAYPPGSADAFHAFAAANPDTCLESPDGGDVALRLRGPFPRGALAEALLLHDFSAIGVPKDGKLRTVFVQPDAAAAARLNPKAQKDLAGLAVAECTVRAEPQKSWAVFGTGLGSPEEKAALSALLPAFGRCLPPTAAVDMEMAALRAYLGEAAYRVSVATARAGGRGK